MAAQGEEGNGVVDGGSQLSAGLAPRAIIGANRVIQAVQTEVNVQHPLTAWTETTNANIGLEELRTYYVDYLKGKAKPAAPGTVTKYGNTLLSFIRSLDRLGEPATLASLTPSAVNRWIREQREAGLSEDGIASRLSALKAFSRQYVYGYQSLTTRDLLERVARVVPPAKPFPRLTDDEKDRILGCFDGETYEDIRNQAFVGALMATGRRFSEVLNLGMTDFDRLSGDFTVRAKGGDTRLARLSPKALKMVRRYLQVRPKGSASDRLWLTEKGEPLSYWGGQSIFRRLRQRSGVSRLHAHLLRHTFAQVALERGAERAAVQDMLGHATDTMSRRYAGSVRQETAAKMMPQYSPL